MNKLGIMRNFFKILNLIILGILLLTFILYILMKKSNTKSINEIKETFQVRDDNDIHTSFFDLSSNFYTITKDELSQLSQPPEDEIILDIGGSLGDLDASKIPWDTENKSYKPSEALWGIVPSQASGILFNKMTNVSQLSDINKLQFDDDKNEFLHESPLFQTTATTHDEEIKLEAAEQVTNLAYPVLGEALVRGEIIGMLAAPFKAIGKVIGKAASVIQKANAVALAVAKVETKGLDKGALRFARHVAAGKAAQAFKTAAAEAAAKAAQKAADKAAAKLATKIAAEQAEKLGMKAAKMVGKMVQGMAITMVSLSAIPFIGPALDLLYMAIVMPLMMALTMSGVIDNALKKFGDPEGCCPPNSVALDILIPDWAQMIISNIPVLGDILSLFFPYMCSVKDSGALVYKTTLTQPKWLEYEWLSCYYLPWPEYNCRTGVSVVYGKTYVNDFEHPPNNNVLYTTTGTYDLSSYVYYGYTQRRGRGYDWTNALVGNYTKLTDVAAHQQNYCQVNRRFINGRIDDSEKKCILPSDKNFFYADFTEKQMLIDMANFYYKFAIRSPYPNDDGTVTIEYITDINYVAASSLYTCDIMCTMLSKTYNPITGEGYTETVTYDRDRRFYYACDNDVAAPSHWEDVYYNTWKLKDDTYDLAVRDLNNYIHQGNFNNTKLDASVLHAAYMQLLDNSNRYVFISNITMNNLSSSTNIPAAQLNNLVSSDTVVRDFYKGYTDSLTHLNDIIGNNLSGGRNQTVINNIMSNLRIIDTASNAIRDWRYSFGNITTNNQYKLVGCTHIDGTGSCAENPNPINLESEGRYRCNFNVKPYLISCAGINMSISKCIDASNVELVIYNYLLQNPTKRIKTINSIKAKGVNCCEFVWDEVTINPTTKAETDLKKNVNTQVLYQQDLSSCSFNLPPPTLIGSTSNYLFGSQTGGTTGLTTTTSLKMFKNPVNSSDPNYTNYTTLEYKQAKFKYPQFTPTITTPTSFIESNVDYIPRYDPATFTPMIDLVRPKKPIRIFYPGEDEKTLGNYSNNYCSDPAMLNRFILSYNGDSNNINKIVQIVRTYTSSSNTCDMEVDMLEVATNHMKRISMTMNMVEGFQSQPFKYQSINSSGGGLNIDKNTDSLSNPYQDGISFGDPYLRSFQSEVVPFTSYFNDDLIKNFTNKTKTLRDNTNRLLVGLTGTRHLGGPSCSTKCQDREVVQRIIEQYNKDGAASTRFKAEQDSILQVLNSATNSSNTCHVLIENKKEFYGDYYNGNTASNYDTENRLAFKSVEMADAGNCTFYPVPNQIYQDISASDLALSSSSNFNTYITPKRLGCPVVNCGDPALYRPAMQDYMNKTGNPINQSNKYIAIGTNKCDYLIKTDISLSNGSMLSELSEDSQDILNMDYVLRVSYDAPIYTTGSSSNCTADTSYRYSYRPNNFVLQTPEDLSDVLDNPEYYQFLDSNSTYTSPLLGDINDIQGRYVHNL